MDWCPWFRKVFEVMERPVIKAPSKRKKHKFKQTLNKHQRQEVEREREVEWLRSHYRPG